ncbi:hypothetical protein [Aquabacterium sp.]|uniref:hypothetical protein n=1 Tax=Aquabacterium sp. TaxID=1872578 RepID=UPI0025C5E11E|nr:hypothetical protein [Aquabacterium sp.]
MYQTITLTAFQRVEFTDSFDFVRVMSAPQALDLEFHRDGREIDEAVAIGTGYSERFAKPCTKLALINGATAQTVTVATRLGAVVEFDKPPTGDVNVLTMPSVAVINQGAAGVNQFQSSVTTASGTMMNGTPTRKAFMIQNRSATGTIWVNLSGGTATQVAGIRIRPGETFNMDTRVPVGAITGIGDAANSDITIVELT